MPVGRVAGATLADVVPAVAAALGRGTGGAPPAVRIDLPPSRSAVVVLVDGLGEHLLASRSGHAPFLTSLPRDVISCGFPSTTVTSLAMLGTGTGTGDHGLVGTEVLDPHRDALFNTLFWDPEVDPIAWQPEPTLFEGLHARGTDVVRIGPARFDGSGLTRSALRGGRFVAAETLAGRVDAAVAAVRAAPPGGALAYLYWGDVDKIGHVHGCTSWEWADELTAVDAALARLAERVGPDCLVVVTADHGMVDVPFADRFDLAHDPGLAAGVRWVGGDPRAPYAYCEPGAAADVLAAWRERLAGRMTVLSREEAVDDGWFGPVRDRVLPRIGDVIASAVDLSAVVDSRRMRPQVLALKGLHGARTDVEQQVPLLVTAGTARR